MDNKKPIIFINVFVGRTNSHNIKILYLLYRVYVIIVIDKSEKDFTLMTPVTILLTWINFNASREKYSHVRDEITYPLPNFIDSTF